MIGMAKSGKAAPKKAAPKGTNGGGEDPETKSPVTISPQPVSPGAPLPQAGPTPQLKILGQYLKDLSFENPNAPQSLGTQPSPPEIGISVNVNARTIAATDYEVEIHLEAKASMAGKIVFAADMLYAGVFRLENIPQEALHPVVLVECPRMLFPFARQILADATRNGGFPPLMLDPIDFAGMYQKRVAQGQAQASVRPHQA